MCANFFYDARDFVPKRQWQIVDPGNTGTIMRVRVTDSGRRNPN
jgi:hypothetical protein